MPGGRMIEAENLTKRYGAIEALKGLSFSVQRGEIVGFLGPNGAGKTTAMRILTGFFPPTTGSARIAGFDLFSQSLEIRKRLGYLPEGVPLYGELRVKEYLRFVADLKGVPPGRRRREIARVLDACGIRDVSQRIVRNLSKGYRQRVGLAQALLNDPEVLILDEPTVGLDPRQIIEIRNLIRNLGDERTVILSTHILPEVEMTCGRVLVLNHGSIVAHGTPEELSLQMQQQGSVRLRVHGPATEIVTALKGLPGVRDVTAQSQETTTVLDVDGDSREDLRPRLARAVVNGGWELLELTQRDLSLEDIFVQLTTEERVPEGAGS